ncbi:MAG: alpha/beta hydrolase [Betaproteobacteria bacterium]|nr:alpha/beta hydrolase [Betaproteobacteria bacterium]
MTRLLFALILLIPVGAPSAEDIVTLPTRGGVTQSYLLSAPESGKARAVAILFPGGAGKTDLERETARAVLDRGNFLVRSRRLLAAAGVTAAVMDAPSDRPRGMDDDFRLGGAHAEDVGKVVADLKARFPGLPVFFVGTSRGTVSAASAASRLGKAVDGVVLTATLFLANRRQPGLSGFDFASIPVPLLFVHHMDDGCVTTPYESAKALAARYPLVSVAGGLPPQSQPCEAMSPHGFLGKEAETVDALSKWMLKQPYPREIN